MCLLDNTSGAAISVRSFLEAAATAGMECHSFTASLFDPQREVNLSGIIGPKAGKPDLKGKRMLVERNGVTHSIFLAKSSRSRNFDGEEQVRFERMWLQWLKENKPKIVITYGSSPYTKKLQNYARKLGSQIVFYLGNAEYEDNSFYRPGDIVLCPSHFLREHYKKTIGLEPQVLRTIMKKERLDLDTAIDLSKLQNRWESGFVTFMTPIPQKGLTLFYALARLAAIKRPDIKFLVTEGRADRSWLAANGFDIAHLPNTWFMSSHEDVRSIFQRTKILLVPSFWNEGFARSVLEAQLCGIPVMSTTRGGLPEALNGGGYLFDIPETHETKFMAPPTPSMVMDWWQTLKTLVDDEGEYQAAVKRALEKSQPFHPDETTERAVAFFEDLLSK